MRLITISQTLEDLDGVRQRRLGDPNRLEPPLEGGVLLDVLAVVVQGGRPDRLELATGQHGFEDGRSIDRALRSAGADEGVDLIDEQDDVAAGPDLLQDLLQPFLEVTAVARTRNKGTEIQRVDLLVLERLGHLALDDVLGQALDDGGLADAGLADQDRVVLGAPGQHLHDPFDLRAATDDRVELALAGILGEVASELVEDQRSRRSAFGRTDADTLGLLALISAEQLDDLLTDPVEVGAELDQHLRCDTLALTDQAQQDVLRAEVVVAELQRLAQAQLEDLLGARGEGDVAGWGLLTLANDLLDLLAHGIQGDTKALKCLGGDAFALVDQAEQNVLGPDVVVVEHARFFLRKHNHPAGPVGKPFKHRSDSSLSRYLDITCAHPRAPK